MRVTKAGSGSERRTRAWLVCVEPPQCHFCFPSVHGLSCVRVKQRELKEQASMLQLPLVSTNSSLQSKHCADDPITQTANCKAVSEHVKEDCGIFPFLLSLSHISHFFEEIHDI